METELYFTRFPGISLDNPVCPHRQQSSHHRYAFDPKPLVPRDSATPLVKNPGVSRDPILIQWDFPWPSVDPYDSPKSGVRPRLQGHHLPRTRTQVGCRKECDLRCRSTSINMCVQRPDCALRLPRFNIGLEVRGRVDFPIVNKVPVSSKTSLGASFEDDSRSTTRFRAP